MTGANYIVHIAIDNYYLQLLIFESELFSVHSQFFRHQLNYVR